MPNTVIHNPFLDSDPTIPVPIEILAQEVGTNCTIGTLLCLDGRQRLAYILGEIFQVSDQVGAEICEITPDNFRQTLSRARRDLCEYLRDNCSLVNPDRECKCARKTRAFIQAGFVDPEKLEFTKAHIRKVKIWRPSAHQNSSIPTCKSPPRCIEVIRSMNLRSKLRSCDA